MKKGMKKFTVPYSGKYFDGGKFCGQQVVFAANADEASKKVDDSFTKGSETPIVQVGKAVKWQPGEKNDFQDFLEWRIDG